MFNSKTLLVGMLVEGNILEKYISKSVKNNMIGKEILNVSGKKKYIRKIY
jgi:hypothetical protein